jgi:FkbM family methyltransferase
MAGDLIFDVGAHKGEDTEFYLRKGFRVVAIEANPAFCATIKESFNDAMKIGQLVVVNVAIARSCGKLDFYINEDISVFGTANPDWVERNRLLGACKVTKIEVECTPLSTIVSQYGVPHYCKIDIEGNDVEALSSLGQGEATPEFVSIESEKVSWDRLRNEFRLLRSLGYRKFKIIDQSEIELQDCPNPPLEGNYVAHKFEEGCSGLFGDELPGRWLSLPEAIQTYKEIFRGYALNGDTGLFLRKSIFSAIGKLQAGLFRLRGHRNYANPASKLPPPGWYDTHASK